ncbi:MAG TPA: hypothetical protein VGD45_33960 [Steroidobacter sp.]|uniref:hypothetical protein n=1 Tax=Steroidobacter sp. TaxID=1978227 RepID=UPI002EDA9C12
MANYPGSNSLINAQRGAESVAGDRQRMALDNLLRRELHVGDPTDPAQIAQALSERYQNDARAQAIDGEARGLPFLRTQSLRPVDITTPTATNLDLDQSRADVNLDLQELITANLSKDIRPELEGWRTVINRSIDEGVSAASFGMDPNKRDIAFAMRRQLGEYARLSRMIGALTPAMNRSFRGLAQSIDEVCAVMLVLMGESMANVGFAGGRFLLQAPYSELQSRRDAVLNALRRVDGASARGMNNDAWPRGMRAYRHMSTVLEAKGQGDLRSLLSEGEIARTMDELIHNAGGGSSTGMRTLGATSWAPLNRLNRFVNTTLRQISPTSPELATLHEAMKLFIEGFHPAGGFRLLRVARPAVLNYGLYGPASVSGAEMRLIDLVNHRGMLARHLDCLTLCTCDDKTVLAQIVLDKMLHEVDRAIDFYCTGDIDLGLPEVRAAACSHMLDFLIDVPWPLVPPAPVPPVDPDRPLCPTRPDYLDVFTVPNPSRTVLDIKDELTAIRKLLRPIDGAAGWKTAPATYVAYLKSNQNWPNADYSNLLFAQVLYDELHQQRETDRRWRPVVEQMTSRCLPIERIFGSAGCLETIVTRALLFIYDEAVAAPVKAKSTLPETLIPRDGDESLEVIAGHVGAIVPKI